MRKLNEPEAANSKSCHFNYDYLDHSFKGLHDFELTTVAILCRTVLLKKMVVVSKPNFDAISNLADTFYIK